MMKQDKGVVLVIEIEHTIVPRTQLPNVFLYMLCNIVRLPRSVVLKKFNIQCYLTILYSCVLMKITG